MTSVAIDFPGFTASAPEPTFNSEIFDKPHVIDEHSMWRFKYAVIATEYDPIVYGENQTRQVIFEGIIKDSYQSKAMRQPIHVRERRAVYTRPGSVSLTVSIMLRGVSRSGKVYHRWETQDVFTWYLTSRDNVATYRKGRIAQPYRKGQKRQMKLKSLPWRGTLNTMSDEQYVIIRAAMRMVFGKTLTMGDLYPVLSIFPDIDKGEVLTLKTYSDVSPVMKALKRNKIYRYGDDFKGVVKALNGGEVNKALLKEAANVDLTTMQVVGGLTLPIDYKVEYLRRCTDDDSIHISDPWPIMRKMDKNQRRSFFKKFLASPPSAWVLRETKDYMVFLETAGINYARALKEPSLMGIHDALEALERQVRATKLESDAVEITCWDRPELNIDLGNGVRIYLAENTMDMVRWGTMFNHCIGSSIHTERCTEDNLYGILEYHGKPLGNFNIVNGALSQAYGQGNTPIKEINKDAYEVFVEYLASVGITAPNYHVGGIVAGNLEYIAPGEQVRFVNNEPWQNVGWLDAGRVALDPMNNIRVVNAP